MALQEILSSLVDKGTDYLIDVPLSYLQKGLGKIGLDTVGNVLVDSGNLIGGGIDKLALGLTGQGGANFGSGLGDLYTGVDTLVGGVLPRGQDFGAGYLAQMFGQGAAEGATKTGGVADGLRSSQDVYGSMFTDATLMDGTPIKFTPSGTPVGKLATSLAPNASGISGIVDKAMSGAKLASAVGAVAKMLDGGGGGSGGSNPTAGRTPASSRIERTGGALAPSRRMGSYQESNSGGVPYSGGVAPRGGVNIGGAGEPDPTDLVVMPGSEGTSSVKDVSVDTPITTTLEPSSSLDESILNEENQMYDEFTNAVNELKEAVKETAEAVEAQEAEEELGALAGEGNISVPLGAGRYSFNPVTF
jgi:hypothetical protein